MKSHNLCVNRMRLTHILFVNFECDIIVKLLLFYMWPACESHVKFIFFLHATLLIFACEIKHFTCKSHTLYIHIFTDFRMRCRSFSHVTRMHVACKLHVKFNDFRMWKLFPPPLLSHFLCHHTRKSFFSHVNRM